MSRQTLKESRSDFRGGRNTTVSPDLLSIDELVDATNARISTDYGGFQKRSGCRRMHPTVLPAAIRGLYQWDSPSGKQIVAISNGDLYHKLTDLGDFTLVSPGAPDKFSTTLPSFFAPFRAATSGAPLVLFIASAGKFYKWTGSALTRIDGVSGAPDTDRIIAYHTRLFARSASYKKNIFWSKVGDGESWTVTGLGSDGGSALVDVLNGEEIVALEVLGGSLALAAEDSIMRFTGHSSDDIIIAQDTEGISAEIGVLGSLALKRAENVAYGLAERGPHAISVLGAVPIGVKVELDFDAIDATVLSGTCIGYHRGRREVCYAVSRTGDTALNKSVFVFSTRLQSWTGPWTYPFGITTFARYEDTSGDEWLMSGSTDGYVRHMDTGALDDVTAAGTGGSNISMSVELAPIFFASGPGTVKALNMMWLQAELPTNSVLTVQTAFDSGGFVAAPALTNVPGVIESYLLNLQAQGKRLRVKFTDASPDIPVIHGFTLDAWLYAGRIY